MSRSFFTRRESRVEEEREIELVDLVASSPSLGTLHKDIVSYIFRILDIYSMRAMAVTCRKFKLLYESDETKIMKIVYAVSSNKVLNQQHVHDLEYPLKLLCWESGLLSWPKFKPAVRRREIKSSPGGYKKAFLWIDEGKVVCKVFQTFKESISECSDAFILFLKGNPVFFQYNLPVFTKEPVKRSSLEYLCISGGSLSADWPKFISWFENLKWIYFKPSGRYGEIATWTITNKQKIRFIIDSADIKINSGNVV
jgi:hypothetical protein